MRLKLSTRLFLLYISFLSSSITIKAQTTIGSDIPPNKGSLLDLKQYDSSDGSANATKGLAMPRVALTDFSSLADINKGKTSRPDPQEHVGLIVYNVTETDKICAGLYLWTGTEWQYLQPKIEYFEDVRTFANGTQERIKYPIRSFGEAGTWMLANLRATTYADNLNVTKPANDLVKNSTAGVSVKTYFYPNNDATLLGEDKFPELGLTYNWTAATNGKGGAGGLTFKVDEGESLNNGTANPVQGNVEQVGVQGVCPDGWHLPSDKEWNDLEKVIANEQTGLYTINGFKSNTWDSDGQNWRLIASSPRNTTGNGHGTSLKNASALISGVTANGKSRVGCGGGGFNLMLSGYISPTAAVGGLGREGQIWTSSSVSSSSAWGRITTYSVGSVTRALIDRGYLNTVRCKKN